MAAAVTGVVGTFVATLVCGAMVFGTGMVAEGGHRITVGGAGHKTSIWPKLDCCGARVVQSVPGHDGGSLDELGRCGGALG